MLFRNMNHFFYKHLHITISYYIQGLFINNNAFSIINDENVLHPTTLVIQLC